MEDNLPWKVVLLPRRKVAGFKRRDIPLCSHGFRVLARRSLSLEAPWRGSRMAAIQLVPLSQISPWVYGVVGLGTAIGVLLLSYICEWMQKLDQGSGVLASSSFLENPTSLEKVHCPSVFEPSGKYMSLVMPAYNEEARLPQTLDETLSYLEGRASADNSFTYEIIIVDDGSKDETVKVAYGYVKKYGFDKVRLVKQPVNLGKGAAVTKGVLCARGELILMLDSDGATKITDLVKLESALLTYAENIQALGPQGGSSKEQRIGDFPLVACGSRAHLEKQALASRTWYRNLLMKGFHLCVLVAAASPIRDTQCGFKMFTRAAARQLFRNVRLKRWCFDVEILYLCRRLRVPTLEIAVNWTEIPGSKLRMTSIFHMLLELIYIRIGYGFNIWKIVVPSC